jgi:hypothetical protein
MRILTKKSTAAIAGLIATVGMLSACSSSETTTSESVSSEIAAVEQGVSTAVVPADVAQAFYVAFCEDSKGTLNEATGECTTPDGATTKIDVTATDPVSAAMILTLAYENTGEAAIPGCLTAAELSAATSGDTPPVVTIDCQIAAIEAMTASMSM